MNCLACKKELELELSGPEEFYYDCPFCRASLLIKEGECELISEGQALDEPSDSLEEGTDVPEIKEEAEPSWQEESADSFQEESAPKEDFSEVVEFAHKEKAKSLFLYDLTLSEINSQEVRDHVLFVLQEEALNLSLQDSQLQDIKKTGKIFLADLSPVQVHVIVHSLMGSPLKIYWKQKHIADS